MPGEEPRTAHRIVVSEMPAARFARERHHFERVSARA